MKVIDLTNQAATGANNYTLPVAGASLGGIKSGTHITIDASGNVSVNDDSHNHIISNVDGLQTALDGKSDTSHTHSGVYEPANAYIAKTNVAQTFTTPQRTSATIEDNVIDFTSNNDFTITLGALLMVTVGSVTGCSGQTGVIVISDTENISGWSGFMWLGTAPTGMTGAGLFSYKVIDSTVYIVKAENV